MAEWKTCTIADLGTVIGGATPSTKKEENYEGGTIAWITPKDLAGFTGRYILRGERNITECGLNSCSAKIGFVFVKSADWLYSNSRSGNVHESRI